MSEIEYINNKIKTLEELACKIERNAEILLKETPLKNMPPSFGEVRYMWQILTNDDLKENQRITIRDYQRFYSVGLGYIKEFQPEREGEFSECYESEGYEFTKEGIMDFLQFRRSQYRNNKDEIVKTFVDLFEIQRSILLTVPDVVEINEHKLREIISGDYIEREIEQSEYLYEKGFERAAGALAGVALEQYLRTQCDKHQIDYNKKETMVPLVQKLYNENKINLTLKKKIEHLASIRNSCDHPSEVHKGEVRELIEGVKKII